MVTKKAQVKVQQTAFMLVGLILFFVLVGLFVLSMSFSGLKEAKQNLDEQEAILLASKLANYPEFSCEESFGGTKTNCVDLDKAFIVSREDKYSSFFGVKNIEIRKTFPASEELCTNENYPDCGVINILSNESMGSDKSAFVSLCRKSSDSGRTINKCELGKIVVRFE